MRALGRLFVLVALGFGVGLLFGVVAEEPERLAGHVRGESRIVARDPTGSGSTASGGATDPATASTPGAEVASGVTKTRPILGVGERAGSDQLPAIASNPFSGLAMPVVSSRVDSLPVARISDVPESALRNTRAVSMWSIQVGAFSNQAAATRLAEGLRARYPVEVLAASGKSGRWRVRVQPIRGEQRARKMAVELKRKERLPTWVTPMEGHSGS